MKKVAVVGGGIFGITSAVRLAKEGYSVDLFEKESDLLQAASGINQYRLHRGYHYQRSEETITSSLQSEPSFIKEYGEAVIENDEYYYCIARQGSLISAQRFMDVCAQNNLELSVVNCDGVNPNKVEACFKVKEKLIDPERLRALCWQKLRNVNVRVLLKTQATRDGLRGYHVAVICTYALLNELLGDITGLQKDYQFELCEKPVVKPPPKLANKSIVIMDGPFMCIDPLGRSGFLVMGNVVHAIHHTNIGKYPEIPERFKPLLNRGVIPNPSVTKIKLFIDSAAEFIPAVKDAQHIGSMYTIRTVLPNLEKTDARPTIVEAVNSRVISVFSGKIGTCVDAAEKVVELIKEL